MKREWIEAGAGGKGRKRGRGRGRGQQGEIYFERRELHRETEEKKREDLFSWSPVFKHVRMPPTPLQRQERQLAATTHGISPSVTTSSIIPPGYR